MQDAEHNHDAKASHHRAQLARQAEPKEVVPGVNNTACVDLPLLIGDVHQEMAIRDMHHD